MFENTFLAGIPLACRADMRCIICSVVRILYITQIVTLYVASGRRLSWMRVGMRTGTVETRDMEDFEEWAESCNRSGDNCKASFDACPNQGFRIRVYEKVSA